MKPRNIPAIGEAYATRFWAKVDRRTSEECWLWRGSTSSMKGFTYGVWSYYDYAWKAHRIAYTLAVGPIPQGLTLDHLCRVKLCCNPAHLEPVTQSVNTLRQYSNPERLYSLTCKRGHAREFGVRCRKCLVASVAKSQAKKPEKYLAMKRMQKQKERMRLKELSV